jgi:hypothetical protein
MRKDASKKRKILLTVAVLVVLVGLIAIGSFAAFNATTTNTGNNISAGSVAISQHGTATTLYNVSGQKPGQSTARCVRVTYSGSLLSSVKLYISSGAVSNGSLYNLQVERGSGLTAPAADMNCTGFTQSSVGFGPATLGSFPTTYATGVDGKASGTAWNTSDVVDYRFTITQNDDAAANAHTSVTSSGSHSFTWEAHNN